MNDFDFEVLQRKRLAHQASHRKCGSKSKKCKMSTDYMTQKQWKERCGEVMTYQLGKPMCWDEFRQIPADLQKEYLLDLIHKYSATASDLAKMFGITPQTVTRFCGGPEIRIDFPRGKRMPKDVRIEFEKFLAGNDSTLAPAELESNRTPVQPRTVISSMSMTDFSLCLEGNLNPEMITNSIIAIVGPDSNVKLEIKCSILP